MYKHIKNPETGKLIKVNSNQGKKILKKYCNQFAGMDINLYRNNELKRAKELSKQSKKEYDELKRVLELSKQSSNLKSNENLKISSKDNINDIINKWNTEHEFKVKILLLGVTKNEIEYDKNKYLIIFFDTPDSEFDWLIPQNYDKFIDKGLKFDYILLDHSVHSPKEIFNQRSFIKPYSKMRTFSYDSSYHLKSDMVYVNLRKIIYDFGQIYFPVDPPTEIPIEMKEKKEDYKYLLDNKKNRPKYNKTFKKYFTDTEIITNSDPIDSDFFEKNNYIKRTQTNQRLRHNRTNWNIYIPKYIKYIDENTGKPYYLNSETNKTQWNIPNLYFNK